MDNNIWRSGIINGILTGLYVVGVATLMSTGNRIFGSDNSVFGGIAVLMLFVLSAVVVGTLVLGRPLMMYLDGAKKEAVKTFGLTLATLFVLTLIALTLLFF